MSRIGRLPITVPAGVDITFDGRIVTVTGPKGTLTRGLPPRMEFQRDGDTLLVTRPTENKLDKSLHGLTRTLVNNMVIGVITGYRTGLEIVGVGYRAQKIGDKLQLALGYSHPIPGHLLAIINFFLDLDLTPEQKGALEAIVSETQNTIKPIITKMHELRSQMDETFLAEEIDTAKASLQIEEMAQLKSQITTVGLNALLQAAQVLTPEQRQTIISTRDEWKDRFTYWRNLLLKIFFG